MKSASETTAYVTATGLGKLLDPVLKPAEVNQLLLDAGLHYKDPDGKTWRPTPEGAKYSVFIKMSETGMNKWSPDVASMLGASRPAAAPKKKSKLGVFGKPKKKVPQ